MSSTAALSDDPPVAAVIFSDDSASDQLSPSSERWFEPWPKYVNMFAERPDDAATVARDLLAARDAELIPFLYSFPWGMEPPEIGEQLHSSNFPFALLDIALDDYWYTELNSAF